MKRKKLLSIVMTVVLSLCSLSPTAVQAQESLDTFPEEGQFKENGTEGLEEIRPEITPQEGNVNTVGKTGEEYIYRELKDGTLEITRYKGNDTELVVPAEIDGKRVTSIGYGAFNGCSSLTSIELPAGVTSIGTMAFDDCSSLTSIELPAGVTSIGDDAFSGCSSLMEIMVDENNTEYASQDGVLYNKNKTKLICSPEGKTGNIVIPTSVTSIGDYAFRGCSSLKEIVVDEKNPAYTSQDGVLYNKDKTELICCPGGKTGDLVIPTSVTKIGSSAFENGKNLTLLVYKGSYAETYAKNEGLTYRYINDSNDCSHTFKTTIVKATTKKNGSITKTCTKCGEQTKKIIYAAKTVKLSKTSYTYNGKNQKPSVTVKDSKGKTLINKKDYTVTYPKAMKNVGSYTVTIKLKGNYKGTVKKTFQIVPKGTQISKVTPKKKGFALKWKKQAVQTTGYEIVYSANKKFTKKTTKTAVIGKNKTVSKTVSKLKAGKKYYVRIRTYKTIKLNGKSKKLYSSWSKIKTVTTYKK